MFEVFITEPAERDIQQAYQWWRDNRSAEQAKRWIEAIYPAMETLARMPGRCPPASEPKLGPGDFRELFFGVGRTNTHRIIFAIEGSKAVVLRVRHVAQASLE